MTPSPYTCPGQVKSGKGQFSGEDESHSVLCPSLPTLLFCVSNPACTDLPTVTIEVDVKNIQYTDDEAELAVTCEVESSPPAQVSTLTLKGICPPHLYCISLN